MPRLLLIGGGHAHVEVLRRIALEGAPAGTTVTIVSPDRLTPYSGMLPGWIAGHYTQADCHIDLEPLAASAGVRFVRDRVTALDAAAKRAFVQAGDAYEFDLASIDTGSTPPLDEIPGARDHALPVKPVATFIEGLDALGKRIGEGGGRIVVVGGGAAGLEVLLAVRHRIAAAGAARAMPEFAIVSTSALLASHNARTRRLFERIVAERGVVLHAGVAVAAVERDRLVLADGRAIPCDVAIVATGAAAPAWPRAAGLATDPRGFIRVDGALRSISHPYVLAAGDVARVDGPPYPKSGVYAVRQGPVLAANLRALAGGTADPLARYTPQPQSLALISAGERYAVASRGRWAFGGHWVWRWKDHIDRGFMAKYAASALPRRG